ncbi:M23 family metallopeptidase [Bartonella choladocola]|uniref:Murein DD-endopeptidase MepM and murein hydrolase activator NlpD, containing LysM domain n=2 Tax=Bartonellaceae TaxID=772 RepID=A0A1U9MGH4_9HYPH|nr:M23 family metallopeptidase [Bartonella choladocola]AQT47035.1 Murein DD-endopeptidase MepM and murein hydrolase activator NlpD, containing LysM domain [Bartonella choladocola]MBI0140385.1 peptidoglycan DD-metalloendopeptidase family protein [Bartonella choladocola]
MRLTIMSKASHRYLQTAALFILAGFATGCSSGTQRFTDSFYTGATANQQQAINKQAGYQQMPQTTGSIQSSELPPVAGQPSYQAAQSQSQPTYSASASQPTQVASAGQVMGTPPHNLGEMPSSSSSGSSTTAKKNGSYIVQSGDTLYSVSRKTGVSVESLKSANGLSNGAIRVGQSLIVPGGHNTEVASANTKTATPAALPETKQTTPAKTAAATPQTPAPAATEPAKTAQNETAKPAAEPAVAKSSDTTINQAENVAVVAPQATGISKMRWPAQGRILSSFGQKDGSSTNDGIDIMAPEGSSVKAAENGVVIYAGDGLKEFGNTVLIRHENNIVTVYGHNSKILVQRGQKVRRGDEIAKSGMSGNASTPRVHFEVRKNSSPVNPIKYLEN